MEPVPRRLSHRLKRLAPVEPAPQLHTFIARIAWRNRAHWSGFFIVVMDVQDPCMAAGAFGQHVVSAAHESSPGGAAGSAGGGVVVPPADFGGVHCVAQL
jgi:hypothetical protein